MIHYQLWENSFPPTVLNEIEALYRLIFETNDVSKFHFRLKNEKDLLIITASQNEKIIGFKIGYRKNETTFYSWLGAIHPEFRKKGLASKLMDLQHEWAKSNHYQLIETKTMNRWKNMLILNLKHGFDLYSTYLDNKGILKIILQKELK